MRVLYVIATLDPAGAERQMTALCTRLDRSVFEPSVCCLTRGGPLEEELAEAGVPVRVLRKRGKFDFMLLRRLLRAIRDTRPDVVHTWLFTANFWGRTAAWLGGVPMIVASERAADVWKTALHRWIDRRLAERSACVLANAEAVKRFCVERVGLNPDKVRVVRNGIDLQRFDAEAGMEPQEPVPDAEGIPVVGAIARMEPQKGLSYLIEAFRLLRESGREARLWLVGDGPLRGRLESSVRNAGLADGVSFLGRRRDVPALLNRMDVVALPSLWEGLPNVMIEALAAGRCVVATAVDGTPEVVEDGRTGLLVPPRDRRALAAALARLLDDEPLRRRMGAAGRARVEREFRMERMVEETARVYRELAAPANR